MKNVPTSIYALADCNNFFVSCERTVRSELNGLPVVVLSNNDGCVVARSNEAKALGIKMGQPAFELRDLVRAKKVIPLSGNHLLYRRISIQVHDIFRRFAPSTQDYSVDEAFLDMTGIPESHLHAIGTAITEACRLEAGIPVTVGFATTRTLAKIATETAKLQGEPVNVLLDQEAIRRHMEQHPAGDIWGVGRRLALRMYEHGIYTMAHLADRPLPWVRKYFGVNGERTWRELHGESCIELPHLQQTRQKSISQTRTFPHDTTDYDYIRTRVACFAADCAHSLRSMKGLCTTITVFLRSNRFHIEDGYFAPQLTIKLAHPTSDTGIIVATALDILQHITIPDIPFKRAGVILNEIIADVPRTGNLFIPTDDRIRAETQTQHRRQLLKAVDRLNASIDHPALQLASQISPHIPTPAQRYSSSFQSPSK